MKKKMLSALLCAALTLSLTCTVLAAEHKSEQEEPHMNPKQTFYENQAKTIIDHLKKRQMEGCYCPTAADAVKKAMELIPADSSVTFGGSMTLNESGIMAALQSREDITFYDRSKASTP